MPTQRLHPHPLQAGTTVAICKTCLPEHVTADNPALDVMTDLQRVKAVTIVDGASLDNAHQRMIHTGVRLLLVLDRNGAVVGLITDRDLMGEKPMTMAAREHISHDQLRVEHIMTSAAEVQVMDMREVERARVSDVVQALREADRQHALVVEHDTHGGPVVRGVFSLSQIGRQMGTELKPSGIAQSVAELEHLIHH